MKKSIVFFSLLLTLTFSVSSQNGRAYNFPQETMFVHMNTTLLFPGEYLYYKLYCIDKQKRTLSTLSTVAYIELVGASNETAFKHKVVLEKGAGFSDFFIPTTIPSGNYKLIAYTQWMQNTGIEDIFKTDVKVINPYLAEKLKTSKDRKIYGGTKRSVSNSTNTNASGKTSKIAINLMKNTFEKREKVVAKLLNSLAEGGYGDYSISVRKVAEINSFQKPNTTRMSAINFNKNGLVSPNNILPPETEGYFLTGLVTKVGSKIPAQNVDVAISIAGTDFYFSVATTVLDGTFSFTINPNFPESSAIVQLVDDNKEAYEITLNKNAPIDYEVLSFKDFEIDASLKGAITKRSVYNQIENGYYSVKPDTITAMVPANSFVRYEKGITYNLDDYTRFPTMTEVIVEIMKTVYTANDTDGNKVVKVVEREFARPTQDNALLFIDGVFIEDHADFLAFDALQVDRVKFIRNGYVFGKTDYQGVVLVTTKDQNFKPDQSLGSLKEIDLFVPNVQKQYFNQQYAQETAKISNRIPDYRLQLLWQPTINIDFRELPFEFYTSDVAGTYEIVLEGFTNNGTPISSIANFEVK